MLRATFRPVGSLLLLVGVCVLACLAPALATAAGYRDVVMAKGPWGYWGLGETSGTIGAAVDHAGAGNGDYFLPYGTNVFERGTPATPLVGKWDGGVRGEIVPGSQYVGGYVQLPAPYVADQRAFSANVWVRWEGYHEPGRQGIIGDYRTSCSSDSGWSLFVERVEYGSGTVRFLRATWGSDGVFSSSGIPQGAWAMVTATYDGATERIYINGQLAGSHPNTGQLTPANTPVTVGRQDFIACGTGSYRYFHGSTDEPAVWTRALTAEEVASLYVQPGVPNPQTFGGCGQGDHARSTSTCLSDPVNSATGSFTHQVTDASLPGTGVAFEFTRSYNSLDSTSGSLGQGWAHNHAASLSVAPDGDVTFRAEDGQQVVYDRQTDGSYLNVHGAMSSLREVSGGYELTRPDQVVYRFGSQGRLERVEDRNGKGLAYAYDGSGRLETVTDAAGRAVTLSYDGAGKLTGIALPDGRTVSYGYTGGRLTSVTDLRANVWTYTYEGHGWLEKETDPLGQASFRNVYNDAGRVIEQYDALNNKTSFAWDPTTQTATVTDARGNSWKDAYDSNVLQKRIDALGNETRFGYDYPSGLDTTAITAPDGSTTTMSYDGRGNLLTATAPASLNAQKTFTYDAKNNVTSVTDARGKVTTYTYDAAGNTTKVVQDAQTVAEYSYDSSGRVLTQKDGRGNTTTYTYDADGNLASETDPLGNKTTYTYDAAGRMTSKVEPRGNATGANPADYTWTYTYDAAGNQLTETNPLGKTTTYTYDAAGNRTSVRDANNKTTSYVYDAADRLVSETAPDGGVTAYTYDESGNTLTEKNPNNETTSHTYDANNRLASTTTALGNKTTYAYDDNGNLITEVDPRGNVAGANPNDYATTYTYDAAGRIRTETDALGNTTTHTYDAVGNETSRRDANNHTVSYSYDGSGRLVSVTSPGGPVTTYAYDGAHNIVSRTDPNNHVTTYAYDAANRLTNITFPLDRRWTYTYDASGNKTSVIDAAGNATPVPGDGTTSFAYDRANRLVSIDYSDTTPDVAFVYDGVGNRTQMTDGAGSQTYTYDGVNRLTAVTRGSDSFSYDYDLAGNLTRRTYPDGTVAAYGYDAESRLASVVRGGETTTYAYDVAGNLTHTTLPASNGHVEERTYDRAGRLVRVRSVKGASTLVDLSYTLDPVGNPIQVVRSGSAPGTTTYTYDVRDRLTEVCFQASCPGASDPFIRWTYDPVGNRLTEARPTGTTSYTYNAADQLTQSGATTYGYDQNGNQTQAGIRTFGYDLANRLRLTTSGAQTTTYNYDGDGNRLQAIAGIQITNYNWDTSHSFPQVAVERDGTGAVLRRHIYGERRISTIRSATASYYHYDELGSVVNVTSGDGASQWTYSYEPFGTIAFEAQDDPSAAENVLKFTGEMLDPTESYYLRARQYDPATGRFWRPDPLALSNPSARAAFISTYAYVGAQPTVLVDPGGMTGIPPRDADSAVNIPATDNVPAGSGYFRGVVDDPHFSRVEYRLRKRYSYAVKGRWVLLSGYAKTARLKLWLEWKKDDGGWFDDGWKRMGTPTQQVVPHRVTIGAGVRCKKDTVKKIRGVMDVDIIGKHDDSRRDYSIEVDAKCAPDPS